MRRQVKIERTRSLSCLLASALAFGGIAHGQSLTEESDAPSEEDISEEQVPNLEDVSQAVDSGGVERIQVTGSRIRRIDMETAAPVTIIDREAIEQSGMISLGDIFRDSASLSPTGNFAGASGFVAQGSSTLNLLGLGAGRTLVLLNGKRMPVVTGGGLNAVNVDNIPTGMIERIEVLSGGASAIYGADAVGGVINVVTRKQYEGGEVTFFGSKPHNPGGEELELSAFQGVNITDSLNVSLGGGYRQRSPIDKRDRDLRFSSPDRRWTVVSPPLGEYSWRGANIVDGQLAVGDWQPSANCPPENQHVTVPSMPQDVYCAGLREDSRTELTPEKNEWYFAATMDYELSPFWNISGLLNYHHSENIFDQGQFLATSSEPYLNRSLTLSRQRALDLGVIDESVQDEFIQIMAPVTEIPSRRYFNTYETAVGAVYVDGTIGADWNVEAGVSYAVSTSRRKGENILNSRKVHEMLFNQDHQLGADPAFISIDPNRNSALLFDAMEDLSSKEVNDSLSADIFASRPLFALPGGDMSVGFGVGYNTEHFELNPDPRDQEFNPQNRPLYAGTFASVGDGSREIKSVFGEFVAPVLDQVNVEGALRFDDYSDFGSTLNYGLGTKVDVLPFLSLRARAASSFRAPTLSYIHQSGGGGYLTARDERWCQREIDSGRVCELSNPNRQFYVENPGNTELQPEEGTNYTAGFILEPVHNVSLIADYYWINLRKTFQRDQLQDVVDRWYTENDLMQPDEGEDQGGFVNENRVNVDSDGVIASIGLPYRNLGELYMRGMDTRLNASYDYADYRFGWATEYFRLFSFREQEAPDRELRQTVGYFGRPRWRLNNALTVSRDAHRVTLRTRTIGRQGQDPDTATADSRDSKVGEYTRYDMVYGTQLIPNASLQLGVNNIFDTLGGVADGNAIRSEGLVSSSLYSPVGRAYFARITYNF